MPEIVVEHLSKSFGDARALDDVGFVVRDKEFLTLLGPSGCGKTTTLMSIAGFLEPDAGRISCGEETFFDGAVDLQRPAENRGLGIVFQSYAIWPHMTVAQNVAFPLKVRKRKRGEIAARVAETLELVEMGAYGERYPHELSGGQRQRVALARALVYSPTVLLLDEPFSNLDAKLRERARTWLRELGASLDLTTVFVTHDQDEALSMSDRILVMDQGVILQGGSPEEVYRQPSSRFVAEFLGHCNILEGRPVESGGRRTARVVLSPSDRVLALSEAVSVNGGENLEVALRPEAIALSENGSTGGENTFVAAIRGFGFLGDHYTYELDIDGLPLTATATEHFAGTHVTVHIPPEACRVLSR